MAYNKSVGLEIAWWILLVCAVVLFLVPLWYWAVYNMNDRVGQALTFTDLGLWIGFLVTSAARFDW